MSRQKKPSVILMNVYMVVFSEYNYAKSTNEKKTIFVVADTLNDAGMIFREKYPTNKMFSVGVYTSYDVEQTALVRREVK
jgi:hypothetical protein